MGSASERTAIRARGPVAHVNNVPVGTPYEITAIGDPQVLRSGLTIRGWDCGLVEDAGLPVELKTMAKVRVPAYTGPVERRFATLPQNPSKRRIRQRRQAMILRPACGLIGYVLIALALPGMCLSSMGTTSGWRCSPVQIRSWAATAQDWKNALTTTFS